MLAYLSFELRRLLRVRSVLLFGALLPMTLYVVFTGAAAESMSDRERGIPVAALVMVMMAGWGAVMGVLSFGSGVAYERAGGWLRQLRATPLPPSRVVAGKGLASTLTALPPVVAIGAAAAVQHGVSLPASRWLLIAAVMWLGTVPFALLGLAIGYALSRELAGPATTGAWLGLSIAGGLTGREREVLAAAVDGTTVADIAGRLHLSEHTVRNHLSSAIGRTGARNRIEAAHTARANGWL